MSIVFTPQLCQFISSEGGTGKSRIIVALIELFGRMGQSHRPLVTPGIAITNINKIIIHSIYKFIKDTAYQSYIAKIVYQMKEDPDKH
jgi:hypothetical protein